MAVICQERKNMAPSVAANVAALPMTFDSVEVNACWAPMTSELSRETSEPVWVRVKKATGWRCTWSNTAVRRSKISPSPMRAENHRCVSEIAAPATARPTSTNARPTTRRVRSSAMPTSMICR